MWEFLKKINAEGVTIILTTHYLEEAEMLCRSIGIIDKGVLVECTSMKSLLSKLDMETFVLDIKQPLVEVPKLGDITVRLTDPATLEVDLVKSHSLNAVFGLLSEQGVEVLSMRNKANRLEELFVKLVENAQGGKA